MHALLEVWNLFMSLVSLGLRPKFSCFRCFTLKGSKMSRCVRCVVDILFDVFIHLLLHSLNWIDHEYFVTGLVRITNFVQTVSVSAGLGLTSWGYRILNSVSLRSGWKQVKMRNYRFACYYYTELSETERVSVISEKKVSGQWIELS